jgi:hypothetical protein
VRIVSDEGIRRLYGAKTDASGQATVIRNGFRFEVLSMNANSEPTFASPAISDGDIIIRSTENLYLIRNAK